MSSLKATFNSEPNNAVKAAFFSLCEKNDDNALRELIENYPSLVHESIEGDTGLLFAIKSAQPLPSTVRVLVELGSDVNLRGIHGHRPLMSAAANGHVEIIGILLEHGADIHATDDDKETMLHWAARFFAADANSELIETLLVAAGEKGNLFLEAENSDGETAFWVAAENGQESFCLALLAAGANYRKADQFGETVLDCAIKNNLFQLSEEIIKREGFVDMDRVDRIHDISIEMYEFLDGKAQEFHRDAVNIETDVLLTGVQNAISVSNSKLKLTGRRL